MILAGIVFYWTFAVSILAGPTTPDSDWQRCQRAETWPCTTSGWRETGRYGTKATCEKSRASWTSERFLPHACEKVVIGWTD